MVTGVRRPWRSGAAWLGFGLGLLGVASFFASVGLGLGPRIPALRDTAVIHLLLIGVGLGVSAVAIRRSFGPAATRGGRVLALVLGALNLGLSVFFVLLLYPLATLPATPNAPQVGQLAPDFTLTSDLGTPVELAGLRGRNVLLVFYRGHW